MAGMFAISYEKDLGGQHRFLKGIRTANGNLVDVNSTWSLGQAKFYPDYDKALKMAKDLCFFFKFKKQIRIHEWTPDQFTDAKVVKVI
jgi:hypothetical protein